MAYNLKNRHFLSLRDFSAREIRFLLKLSAELKAAKYAGTEVPQLKGKDIALIFEKDSTRTRIGFEVAAFDQGARVTYLGPTGSHLGKKETVKDTARVLGRVYDAIEYRGYGQDIVDELAEYSGVPVYNGLTDEFHPTQILADLLTMQEHTHKPLGQISFVFMGDVGNNMGNSLMIGAAKMGMDVRLCGPKDCWPDRTLEEEARMLAKESGAQITITDDVEKAVAQVDFIYTDVWLSMGEPMEEWGARIAKMMPYQVNAELMYLTGNPGALFMHCLPAFHSADTSIAKNIENEFGVTAMEVTDDVFESENSIVFDQAENRLHTIKAVLVATLGS
ncbi:MAG: ornithine carbamoyltransferase [Pseudomonadota bacterium]